MLGRGGRTQETSSILYPRGKNFLAWEHGVVCEFGLGSRGNSPAKPAPCHFPAPHLPNSTSGAQRAGTGSVGQAREEVEVGPCSVK